MPVDLLIHVYEFPKNILQYSYTSTVLDLTSGGTLIHPSDVFQVYAIDFQ